MWTFDHLKKKREKKSRNIEEKKMKLVDKNLKMNVSQENMKND